MVKLYFDVHVYGPVATELRKHGVDVLTAQEDGSRTLPDDQLLSRAGELGRVLVSFDADLLTEAHHRLETGTFFAGLVYGHQQRLNVGKLVEDLELIAKINTPQEMANTVTFLPL